MVPRRTGGTLIPLALASGMALPAGAQQDAPASSRPADPPAAPAPTTGDDVVVEGRRIRNGAAGAIEPVAVLDADAIAALGATSMKDLIARLKGVSGSAAGGDPAMLLNGRRISGPDELYSLPYEAIERIEVLSEQDAARFGFAPTVRVMNFITKKHFRAISADQTTGTTTEGGGTSSNTSLGLTRINDERRLAVNGAYQHQGRILQSARAIVPDPAVPFAIPGNVTGIGGGSIAPALDALAGRAVTIAAVPATAATRGTLGSYAGGVPAVTDIGPYRTLQPATDQLRLDGTVAVPVGRAGLSIDASVQNNRSAGLNGLAAAAIAVPAESPALPFATPVVVDRYFPDTVLHQSSETTALHAGANLQGGMRWSWTVSSRYDRADTRTASEFGVPTDALQAAVAAGGDPLTPLDPDVARQRSATRNRSRTDTVNAHALANGPVLRLPAGDALVTLNTDWTRSASDLSGSGAPAGRSFARSVTGASAAIDLPIASASRGVLPFAGRLGVSALIGLTRVSGYGRLVNSNLGFAWTPVRPVTLLGSTTRTRTAPAINLLIDPLVATPNVPVFDYVTGTSAVVTTFGGGNPALGPERRRTNTLSVQLQPFAKKEFRLTVDLADTLIEGQSASLGNVTAPFQAAFPGLFGRDGRGGLVSVDLRPVNLARERERKLHWALTGNTSIGRTPPPPPRVEGKPPPPPPRLFVYAFLGGNYRFSDRLELADGQPALDLLDGASLTGTGGRPRWDVDGTIGADYGPANLGVYGQLQGSSRIRSDLAAADLRFSGRTMLVLYSRLEIDKLTKAAWARRVTVNLSAENILNDRIAVRDRNGDTPNRFQAAYLDPAGRTVRLALRKLF